MADFFPNSYKPKEVAFGSFGTKRDIFKAASDLSRASVDNSQLPGPGSYLQLHQVSSFAPMQSEAEARRTNE